MNKYYPHLFSPIKVGRVTLKNRIMSAPMGLPEQSENRHLADFNIATHEARARGGAASSCVGDCCVSHEGRALIKQMCMDDPLVIPSLTRCARTIKRYDCVPVMELSHAGMFGMVPGLANPEATGRTSYGPVEMFMENGTHVVAMDEAEMARIAECYADSARKALMCGYEMIILHGGHGWMLNQFLSPAVNTRTDEYGGSTENRCRFPIRILKAIREAVGDQLAVDFRMSGDEIYEGGYRIDEGCRIAQCLEPYLDMIHISCGNHEVLDNFVRTHPDMFYEEGCNVQFAAEVKKHVKIPVACVGAISDPAMAEEIIASGKADVVCLARALVCDPDWPRKARAGKPEEIRTCMRCMACQSVVPTTRLIWCSLNPECGNELDVRCVQPPRELKKVLIAGGGPAGMQAAIKAAERGHHVILCEATGALGGQILCEKHIPFKKNYYKFSQWLIRQVRSYKNIDVRMNTPVTRELVDEIAPDTLICAVGSVDLVPPIPGIDKKNVLFPADLSRDTMPEFGDRVVIIGGGLVGCETAVHLKREGKKVTIVEMKDSWAQDAHFFHRVGLDVELRGQVEILLNTTAKEIRDDGLVVVGADGEERLIPADTVFVGAGRKPLSDVREALRDTEADPEFFAIGDCVKPGTALWAVHGGYFTALNI